MGKYASETSVSITKSRDQIERNLRRYGADGFGYAWVGDRAEIKFQMAERQIRFVLTMPDRAAFATTPTGKSRAADAAERAWEQAGRQHWRALNLCILAKLEAVEVGISTFEDEFMAHIVMPDGMTIAHHMAPMIAHAYSTGQMPPLMLPHLTEAAE